MKTIRHLLSHAATAALLLSLAAAAPASAADHRNFGRLNADGSVSYAPASFVVDGRVISEFALSDSDYLKRGYSRIVDVRPAPSAPGAVVVATGWTRKDGKIYRVYEEQGGGASEETLQSVISATRSMFASLYNEDYFEFTATNGVSYDVAAGTNGVSVVFPTPDADDDAREFVQTFSMRLTPALSNGTTRVWFQHLNTEFLEFQRGRDLAFGIITNPVCFTFTRTQPQTWSVSASVADSACTLDYVDQIAYAPTGTNTFCVTMLHNPFTETVNFNKSVSYFTTDGTPTTPIAMELLRYVGKDGAPHAFWYKKDKGFYWQHAKLINGRMYTVTDYTVNIEPGATMTYTRRVATNLVIRLRNPAVPATTNSVTNAVSSVRMKTKAAGILPGKNLATSATVSQQGSWPIRRQDSMAMLGLRLRRRETV